ncbi:hypothetical protein STAS_14069 [Striga asiatica]|uniref:KIB1-4 beta-propeller domain-containing protein n=1 Tax=Striga asiatica TaxID=4170 RepID=A0A5A7PXP0_STRAF|nr:hypothetical protein STAS_14069 [Striga asiatica]
MARNKCVMWHEDHLIEAPGGRGLLLVVKLMRGYPVEGGEEFKVFRVEVAGRVECVELDSLDDWTLFVNHRGGGFCRLSSTGGGVCRPNSIYYTDKKGRAANVYDLGEKSTTRLLPFRAAGRYFSLSEWVDLPNIPEPEAELEVEP